MGTTTVGGVNVEIGGTTTKLEGAMDQSKGIVDRGMRDIAGAASVAQAALAALGGSAFVGLINSVIESAAGLQDMSEKTGVSVEALSALRSVAKLSGTDMQEVVGAVQKLSKSMVAANDPASKQAEIFKSLGINVMGTNGIMKTADQVFLELSIAQSKYGNSAQIVNAMNVLMKGSGANLLPVMNDLAEKGNLNGKVTTAQAQAADQFQKQLIVLKSGMEGYMRGAVLPLLPLLTTMGPLLKDLAIVTAAYFAVFTGVPAIMGGVTTVLTGLGPTFTALTAQVGIFKATMLGAFGIIAAAFAGWEIGTWLRENFVEAQLAGIAFVDGLLVGWETIKYGAEVAWLGVKTAFNTAIGAVGELFATQLSFIAKGLALVGAGSAADGIKEFAASLRAATSNTTTFSEEQSKLKSQYDKNVTAVRAITGEMADEAISQDALKRSTKATTDAKAVFTGSTKEQTDASDKHAKKIADVIKALDEELKMLGMSANEKLVYKELVKAGADADSDAGRKIRDKTLALAEGTETLKLYKDWQEANTKAAKEHNTELEKETQKLNDKLIAAQTELANFGLTRTQIESNTLSRMRETLAIKESEIATSNVCDQRWLDVEAMRAQIKAQEGIVEAITKTDVQIAQKKQAEDALKSWQDTARDIERALTDSLMRGFESGKDMVTSLRDYIVNAAKSMVVKLAVQPIMGGLTSIVGGLTGNAAMAADGTAKTASGMSSIMSTISTISTMASAFGSSIAAGFSSTIASFGATTGLAIEGGMASIAAGTSTSIAAGLGQIIGTLGPYALAAVAVYGLLGGFKGTYVKGQNVNASYDTQGNRTSRSVRQWDNVSDGGQKFDDFLGGIANTYQQMAKTLGLKRGALDLGFETNDSDGGKFGFSAAVNGRQVLGVNETKITDGAIELTASRAVFAALQASEMPKYLAGVFDGMTASAMTQEQLNAAVQTAQAYQALHTTLISLPLANLRDLSYQAASGLVAAAGGMDTLIKGLQSYYDLYFSESEKNAVNATSVVTTLASVGIDGSGLTTREDFRALFESVDATTSVGQQQIAALLQIAPTFAPIADYLTAQGKTLADLATIAPQLVILSEANSSAALASTTAADATTAAIQTTTTAVESGTTAVVGAVAALSTTVSAAVISASTASTDAINRLTSRLDALESNNRLAAAA